MVVHFSYNESRGFLNNIFSLGKHSGIKCKRESAAPRLWEFIEVLEEFWLDVPKLILVVTDDSQISEEISRISKEGIEFLKPDPAPKRIPDKVCNNFILNLLNNFSAR